MHAIYTIFWFVGLLFNIACIFHFIGFSGITRMFPEGHRRWHFPVQLLTLATFAVLVLVHPFKW
jgi:hypothetical protein